MIFEGNLLRTQMLLHRHGEVGPALHGRVIADNQAFPAFDTADPGDHAGGRCLIVIHAMGGQRADLQKGTAGVQQLAHPVTRQQLASLDMALARSLRASQRGFGRVLAQLIEQALHAALFAAKRGPATSRLDFRTGIQPPFRSFWQA